MPRFISRTSNLTYDRCAALFAKARDPGRGKPLSHNQAYYIQRCLRANPFTNAHEQSYSLKMYNTHILVYFPDGAITLNDWNSVTTTMVLNYAGPVRVWNRSTSKFTHKRRFAEGWNSGDGYPLPGGGMDIDPEGYVHGLVGHTTRVIPALKGERREIIQNFRRRAFARLALGESPELVESIGGGKYLGYLPQWKREELFEAFNTWADHDDIARAFVDLHPLVRSCFGRTPYNQRGGIEYPSAEHASNAVIAGLLRTALDHHRWYEQVPVHYDPVRVRT